MEAEKTRKQTQLAALIVSAPPASNVPSNRNKPQSILDPSTAKFFYRGSSLRVVRSHNHPLQQRISADIYCSQMLPLIRSDTSDLCVRKDTGTQPSSQFFQLFEMARATIELTEFKQEGYLHSTARKSDSCYLTSGKRPTPLANFTAVLQKKPTSRISVSRAGFP